MGPVKRQAGKGRGPKGNVERNELSQTLPIPRFPPSQACGQPYTPVASSLNGEGLSFCASVVIIQELDILTQLCSAIQERAQILLNQVRLISVDNCDQISVGSLYGCQIVSDHSCLNDAVSSN